MRKLNYLLYRILITVILLFVSMPLSAQDETELFLIDSYVTPERPYTFKITFFVTEKAKAEIEFDKGYKYLVSDQFLEDHSGEYNFDNVKFDSATAVFYINIELEDGTKAKKGPFEIFLPHFEQEIQTEKSLDIFTTCCIGGTFFGMPSITMLQFDGETKYGLNKEIPILSVSSTSSEYPDHLFSVEYGYIYDIDNQHHLRAGYKYLNQPGLIEFVSTGASVFTDFNGFNGVGAEATVGLFKFYGIFTVYSKYRFNFQPTQFDNNFHEISIGLFSDFFSYHL